MIILEFMKDSSEIVRYNDPRIPVFTKTEQLSQHPHMHTLSHWHEDLEFIRVLSGNMYYRVNTDEILLREGDCLFINSRQMHHTYAFRDQDCTFQCVLIHPAVLTTNRTVRNDLIDPLIRVPAVPFLHLEAHPDGPGCKALSGHIDEICQSFSAPAHKNALHAIGLAHIMLADLTPLLSDTLPGPVPDSREADDLRIQKNMITYIYENYPLHISLQDIADAGNIGRNKCCSLFRKYLEMSPVDFVNDYRLEVSRELLKDKRYSIAQIAAECGFSHQSYYSKAFRFKFGCTPREYRSRLTPGLQTGITETR